MGGKQSFFKIVVIGMSRAGKTTFCSLLEPREKLFPTEAFNYFEFQNTKRSIFQVWDLNGKHPHLWSHYMSGVNGFVFVIDQAKADKD